MRGAYLQYCTDHPDETSGASVRDYAVETSDGEVLVASDADIAVIAHHAARFASDCLVPSRHSKFPFSMYLIGLAKAWVFEAPFATIPISMESFSVSQPQDDESNDLGPDNVAFLLNLLNKCKDASASAT
jgi:hypothetical protein